jgi:PilZ domain
VLLPHEAQKVELHDLSESGAGLVSTTPYAVGTVLTLRVGIGPMRLPRMAKVTRCDPETEGSGYRIGVAFVADLAGRIGGAFGRVA